MSGRSERVVLARSDGDRLRCADRPGTLVPPRRSGGTGTGRLVRPEPSRAARSVGPVLEEGEARARVQGTRDIEGTGQARLRPGARRPFVRQGQAAALDSRAAVNDAVSSCSEAPATSSEARRALPW